MVVVVVRGGVGGMQRCPHGFRTLRSLRFRLVLNPPSFAAHTIPPSIATNDHQSTTTHFLTNNKKQKRKDRASTTMSDVDMDAYITARRLLVRLLQSELSRSNGAHHDGISSPPPSASHVADNTLGGSRLHVQATAFPSEIGAATEQLPFTEGARSVKALEVPRRVATEVPIDKAPAPLTSQPPQKKEKEASPQPSPPVASSTFKGRSWWRRTREQLSRLVSLHTPSDTASRNGGVRVLRRERGRRSTLSENATREEEEDKRVRAWRAAIHSTLRRQSSALESCLCTLLNQHVQTALTAAVGGGASAPGLGTTTHAAAASSTLAVDKNTASSSPPPIHTSKTCIPSMCDDDDAEAEPNATEEAVNTSERSGTSAAWLSPSPLYHGFPVHIRLVSAGYAATISARAKGKQEITTAVTNVEQPIPDFGDAPPLPRSDVQQCEAMRSSSSSSSRQTSAAACRATAQRERNSAFLSRGKSRCEPMTLREQLNACMVQTNDDVEGRRCSPTTQDSSTQTLLAVDKVGLLLSQLHQVQRASLFNSGPAVNPLTLAPAPRASESPPLSLPLAAAARCHRSTPTCSGASGAQCTVWECIPLSCSSSSSSSFFLSSTQSEHSVDGGKSGRPSRGAAARWKKVRSTHFEGQTHVADFLCAMSDGECSLMQSSVRDVQELSRQLSTSPQTEGASTPLQLCAYSPFSTQPKTMSPSHEQVVVCYATAPYKLNTEHWTTTSATTTTSDMKEVSPGLDVFSSWVIRVEVDAVHATWLRRTLLAAAVSQSSSSPSSCPAQRDAPDTDKLRALIMFTLEALSCMPSR